MQKLLEALQSYTNKFYSNVTFKENTVASPLGSWMLVASVANSIDFTSRPDLKKAIESNLGMKLKEAETFVKKLTSEFPALNYVSKAWTSPNLQSLPAVEKWVKKNSLIPQESAIPSQQEIDSWVSDSTHDLIREFPADINDSILLIIANVIYSKITWTTKFVPVPASGSMTSWGVDTVLNATATNYITFWKDESGKVFAAYNVEASGEDKESVRLFTCLSEELPPAALLEILGNYSDLTRITADDATLLKAAPESYRVKDIRMGSKATVVEVNVPAWEASSKFDLLATDELGYDHIIEGFGEGSSSGFDTNVSQVAVARFDKDGFEAAALTSMVMARAVMPRLVTQTVYELNFSKPFAYVSYVDGLPVFSGYISTAKEGE